MLWVTGVLFKEPLKVYLFSIGTINPPAPSIKVKSILFLLWLLFILIIQSIIFEKDISIENSQDSVPTEPKKKLAIKKSVENHEPTDPGLTRELLEKAIQAFEKETAVTLLSMKLSKNGRNETVADLKAQLGGSGETVLQKSYRWIIKEKKQGKKTTDLNNYMMVDLGPQLVSCVTEVMKNKKTLVEAPGRQG